MQKYNKKSAGEQSVKEFFLFVTVLSGFGRPWGDCDEDVFAGFLGKGKAGMPRCVRHPCVSCCRGVLSHLSIFIVCVVPSLI